MSDSSNKAAEKIERERPIRSGGGSSVITIPPIFFEFTEFSENEESVKLEADFGDDEITIRLPSDDDSTEN